MDSFFHSFADASAEYYIVKSVRRKCALLTAGEKEQQGVVLTDEGPPANRKEVESRGGCRLGPLMVPVWFTPTTHPRCSPDLEILLPDLYSNYAT